MTPQTKNYLFPRYYRNREYIIDKAAKEFTIKGFESTSMEQIAKAAQYSKPTLYKYFNNKEELILAIATRAYKILQTVFDSCFNQEKNLGFQRLSAVGFGFFQFALDHPLYRKALDVSGKILQFLQTSDKWEKLKDSSRVTIVEFNKIQREFANSWITRVENVLIQTQKSSIFDTQELAILLIHLSSGLTDELINNNEFLKQFQLDPTDLYKKALTLIQKGLEHTTERDWEKKKQKDYDPISGFVPLGKGG